VDGGHRNPGEERKLVLDLLEEACPNLEEVQGGSSSRKEYLQRARCVLEASRPVLGR
jgi:hypothetical protein